MQTADQKAQASVYLGTGEKREEKEQAKTELWARNKEKKEMFT